MKTLRRIATTPWAAGSLLVALSLTLSTLNTDFHQPPRGDGVGYAILGLSIAENLDYRELDKPNTPRHAHFPPGYPVLLALVWSFAGRSEPAAHSVSLVASALAVLLAWRWFRTLYPPVLAFLIALALALNWTWARLGGEILSEPVYQVWQMLALLIAARLNRFGGDGKAIALGLVLGASTLTRYVGAPLALAIILDLAMHRRFREILLSSALASILVLPWVLWIAQAGRSTHLGLLPDASGLFSTIAHQSLFYLQRIPDQIVGPFVEVGTIYHRSTPLLIAVHLWAILATGLVLAGWWACLSRLRRRRIVGLWSFLTLALLLIWPFTEAGRFLVPLVPAILVGATEGLTILLTRMQAHAWVRNYFEIEKNQTAILSPISPGSGSPEQPALTPRHPRRLAMTLLIVASVPYSVHAITSQRAQAARQAYEPFDEICRWLADSRRPEGSVLTNHPAEVYWQTGRQAWSPADVTLDDPDRLRELGIRYFLVEPGPPDDPLRRFVESNPGRFSLDHATGPHSQYRVY